MEKDLRPIRKVLVVVPESDHPDNTGEYAISIAEKYSAEVIVLDIVETQPWLHGRGPYGWASPEKSEKVYAKEKQRAQNAAD